MWTNTYLQFFMGEASKEALSRFPDKIRRLVSAQSTNIAYTNAVPIGIMLY